MKSIRIISGLLIILSFFIIANCGDDKNTSTDPESSVPPELIGTWTYQSATIDEHPIHLGFVLFWHSGTVSARFTIGADGSFFNEELDSAGVVHWTENGTFTVDGNNATITLTSNDDGAIEPPKVLSGTWALNENENELTMTTTLEEAIIVLIATKDNPGIF